MQASGPRLAYLDGNCRRNEGIARYVRLLIPQPVKKVIRTCHMLRMPGISFTIGKVNSARPERKPLLVMNVAFNRSPYVVRHCTFARAKLDKIYLRFDQIAPVRPAPLIRVVELENIVFPKANFTDVIGTRGLFKHLVAAAWAGEHNFLLLWFDDFDALTAVDLPPRHDQLLHEE